MKFNENIRNLRKEKGLSQEHLAEKLGVTRQTISKWENGAAMPNLKKLTEIADFFNVSMDTILGMEIENKSSVKSSSADDNNSYSNENNYNKEYTNQLFSIVYQNQQVQNQANHKALKLLLLY
ncbi:MAG: helix-turn-helix domain-containing protein [Eubacterium sp.]|nr:helix-turn-helix domain-containing protein [Eubacterium sp.]